MTNFIATLQYYFSYPFVQYALIVGVLIALCLLFTLHYGIERIVIVF